MKKIKEFFGILYIWIYKAMIRKPRNKRVYVLWQFAILAWICVAGSIYVRSFGRELIADVILAFAFFLVILCIIALVAIFNVGEKEIDAMMIVREFLED